MTAREVERTEPFRRNSLEGWIERYPPYDCTVNLCAVPDCPGGPELGGRSHGRGTARYRWILRGEGLAVQWMWFADEHLPETVEYMTAERGADWSRGLYPMAYDLGYHAATPLYECQDAHEGCDLLGLPQCYYDGSGLQAEPGMKLLAESDEAVWAWLEEYWHYRFAELTGRSREVAS